MKEIQEIIKKIESLEPDENAVLATVVDVQGSSYRLPGAKMLILENGETYGTVSGGCLEADVLERAKRVLETGEPQVFTYDTTDDLDSVFSLNMGCRGVIRLLLEPARNNALLEFIKRCFDNRESGSITTLVEPADDLTIGSRLLINRNSEIFHTECNGDIHSALFSDAVNAFRGKESDSNKCPKAYEFGEVFREKIIPPLNCVIFGAGADAVPVAEIGESLGWRISVVDHRPAFANRKRFQTADEIILSRPEDIGKLSVFDENTVAIVMTHNYEHDKQILKFLIPSAAAYVGALGPKRRTSQILQELTAEGIDFSEDQLKKLYAPVGLDIGADTPEAIALSIVAEIQAVLKDRSGGFLRDRKGSIYGRDE
jgi:xanthine dehydrogenase accessory factor